MKLKFTKKRIAFTLLILILTVIAIALALLVPISITNDKKEVEIKFNVINKDDKHLYKGAVYIYSGTSGTETTTEQNLRTRQFVINLKRNITEQKPMDEIDNNGTAVDTEGLVKEIFGKSIDAIKVEDNASFDKYIIGSVDLNNVENDTRFDNISIDKVTLNELSVKLNTNDDYIAVGNLNVTLGNCNKNVSIDIKYSTKSGVYKLDGVNNLTNNLCLKYIPPPPATAAQCNDCLYYPVDKQNSIPGDYTPNVQSTDAITPDEYINVLAYNDLIDMFNAAQNDGVVFRISSGYRSYVSQANTFEYWVQYEMDTNGLDRASAETKANTYSALPGHSEHQLGTALDITSPNCTTVFDKSCTDNDTVWNWLKANAYKYGFVLSYPEGKDNITGYIFEPWHYRWLGKDLAAEYHGVESTTYVAEFLRNKHLWN